MKTWNRFSASFCLFGLLTVTLGEDRMPYTSDIRDVTIIVLSQANSYHAERAEQFIRHIKAQEQPEHPIKVHLLHEKWPQVGAWTILSIIPSLAKEKSLTPWVLFCTEETRIKIDHLLQVVSEYDPNKEWFIGHALQDKEPTIIHHFAFHEDIKSFHFPNFASGVLMSQPLIKRVSNQLVQKSDFSIDAKHELAMAVWNKGDGIRLVDNARLCAGQAKSGCATSYTQELPNCGPAVPEEDLYVAVKTCSKYHESRVPVVKKTWEPEAKYITYYSDVEDATIPTIDLGVANTQQGHCAKTLAILEHSLEMCEKKNIPWVIVVDDDTIISLRRLRKLLTCYDPNEAVVLGEVYGYGAETGYGYDYITGGGGMVFSYTALLQLLGSERCTCGKPDAPDDMILGMCFKRLAVPLTHSPLFHQARPADYAVDYIKHQTPISFHKHWNVDPISVYEDYLKQDISHDEL